MTAHILDGRALASEMRADLTARASALRAKGTEPRLTIVFVGENESSIAYVRNLVRSGERCGIDVCVERLPESSDTAQVRASLERDEVLAMAPDVEDGRFAVPRILGEDQ